MAGRFQLKAPVVRESALHKQVADVLRLEIAGPGQVSRFGVVWWSVDMAAYGGVAPGLRTGRGCIAGVPDMQVVFKGRSYFVELKRPDGQVSPAQQGVATALALCDAPWGVARDWEEVLGLIDAWEIPRNHRVS